jgi:Protein of unknown function (DUF3027)
MRDTCPVTQPREPADAGVDALLAAAVELARAAALEIGDGDVGEPVGCQPVAVEQDGAPVAEHLFACVHPGYRGWRWSVTVTRAPDATEASEVTVDEVALLPGPDALLAPAWLPWQERIQPGDVGPGDLLPATPDDPRLVPAYAGPDDADPVDPEVVEVALELGLGRPRVLSLEGRVEAAERWEAGPGGPDAPIARQAPGPCGTCAFYLPLRGVLGRALGACGNEYASDDGRIVTADHGCGAHSEAVEASGLAQAEAAPPLVDDYRYEYEVTPS